MEVPYTAVCWMCNGVGLWPPIEREPVTVADECPVCHGYRTVPPAANEPPSDDDVPHDQDGDVG